MYLGRVPSHSMLVQNENNELYLLVNVAFQVINFNFR